MKNLIIALSALAITVSSCRKIIDIKLEEGDKKTVIEASLYEGTNDFRVKITQTGNFFGDNSPVIINNATVNLNDGVSTFPLSFTGNGNYYLLNFNAVSGTEYTLTVDENGNSFEASVTVPTLVPIDTITYQFVPDNIFTDEGYLSQLEFDDPAGEKNFYRLFVTIAESTYGGIEDLILLDDGFTDGNRVEFPTFVAGVAQLNDTVKIELHSCDEATLTYLEGVDAVLGGGNGAPPANPDGNFNNGALGNFNVYAISEKTVVIVP
jgi:hypothetical protein|tara:strand:- start:18 stop:812 length:795 start_codon:yes stop_codon:yes gene_type:complete